MVNVCVSVGEYEHVGVELALDDGVHDGVNDVMVLHDIVTDAEQDRVCVCVGVLVAVVEGLRE
jgi:hypothetical protein